MVRGAAVKTWSESVIVEVCFDCGMPFGMSSTFRNERLQDGETFCCPAGHEQHYTRRKNREQQLEEQLATAKRSEKFHRDRAEVARAEAEHQRRSKAAMKGHLTRIKRRIANGVCPCCNRSFKNLRDHMAGQHPEFVEELKAKEAALADG